ncbi:TIM barrel protein [Cereibacter azotoformans]|uniref:Protein FrlC n=1 Tax=Cereibacter azotoformans TaxID=43057 RepID=A0A2T5K5W1_9RHOB|nr:TIM barrel protein [Cereibacter azotoformans]AXQ95611.1 AP endonuclease [Cereibacter sphaeroides]PTR17803.1 protein FrlC [Cereibacter azotoformans]UIJ32140.1 TIM barrel protein [Cereibacter azotoformans]
MSSPRLAARQLIGSNFAFQHYPFPEVARLMRGFGLSRIELWGVAPHLDLFHADAARVAEVKRVLAGEGLSVRCLTPEQVVYPINIASGDDAFRRASIDRFRRAADIAAELGASHLFLTPGRGFETEPAERAWQRSAEALAEIAEHAAGQGLRCLLEPLQRVESNIAQSAADIARLMGMVGAANMDVVLDLVAMACAGDSVGDYMRLFGERLVHVHVVDGRPAGHLVWGDGELPLADWLGELAAAGYGGTLTFEPFGDGSYALDPVTAWTRNLRAIAPHLEPGEAAA